MEHKFVCESLESNNLEFQMKIIYVSAYFKHKETEIPKSFLQTGSQSDRLDEICISSSELDLGLHFEWRV